MNEVSIFPKLIILNNSPMKLNVPGKLKLPRMNNKKNVEKHGR
jgi:hypothetical protein